MANQEFLKEPEPEPVSLPSANATVQVRIIDTTTRLKGSVKDFVVGEMPGFEPPVGAPSFAFLISNGNHHILFDLGIRKDWENLSPRTVKVIKKIMNGCGVEKNVAEILDEHSTAVGVSSKDIRTVIWSHQHFDHIGDMTTFPPSTSLMIGPGVLEQYTPGYPTNPKSDLLDTDFAGRAVHEADFTGGLRVGSLPAVDYFGDGSFYLLHAPGHTRGHMCGLARVSTAPDSFVLMGGDVAHYPGILRPTKWNPLPRTVLPCGCAGAALQRVHPRRSATEPFFGETRSIAYDVDEGERSIVKIQEIDALENVLTVLAHDLAVEAYLDLFPKTINDWFARDLDAKSRWAFCNDFKKAVQLSQRNEKL